MSYREVLAMPIRAFWLFSGNIRRVRADSDMRALMVATAAQSAEGIEHHQERLVLEIGLVMSNDNPMLDVERDEKGFSELKTMAAEL
jgi:hypothetical protein